MYLKNSLSLGNLRKLLKRALEYYENSNTNTGTHLCHAQCTFSATARNVALSHCEAAQVLIKFFESLRPEKKKEYEDDASCSCTYHGNQVRDRDLYETATLLRSQLLAEGSNFADAIAVLTSISSLKTNDTVRKKIDRVKYQADKHGRSFEKSTSMGRNIELKCVALSDHTVRVNLPEILPNEPRVCYYAWRFSHNLNRRPQDGSDYSPFSEGTKLTDDDDDDVDDDNGGDDSFVAV